MLVRPDSPFRSATIRVLLGAFTAVLLLFVLSASYARYSVRAIDNAARSITDNAAPSIEHLAAAREEVRSIELLLDRALDLDGAQPAESAATLRSLRQQREDLQRHIEAYRRTPNYPGEAERWERAHGDFVELEAALDRALAQIRADDLAAARVTLDEQFRPLSDRAVISTEEVIRVNAEAAHDYARQIETIRRVAAQRTALLDLATFWLCVATVLLALRTVWRFEIALQKHRRVAEQRADELEQFAGRIAHDIAGPLTVADLSLQTVARQVPPEVASGTVERGRASVRRVMRLVEGLLGFAKAGAQPERDAHADVCALVSDTVEGMRPAAAEARVTLIVESLERCTAAATPGVVTSLLGNLLANAIKYMGEAKERRVTVRVLARETFVRVEVHDTGPGVAPEIAATLFEPYVRGAGARVSGLGLGLATVKRLAVAHGGAVGHQKRAEGGATFWFELPLAPSEGTPREPRARA